MKQNKILIIIIVLFLSNGFADVIIKEGTISFNAYDYENYLYPSTPWEPCYPYERLDFKSIRWKEKITKNFKLLTLENEYLKITFIPEIGGRIYEAIYKPTGINMFYKNDVIKPAILYGGTGYMYVIGGLKYGFPTYGHAPNNLTPWKYKIINNEDKSISVLTYDTDLETNMNIYISVTLRPYTSLIELKTKLENPTPYKRRYYYWICAALEPNDNVEFIFPTDRMILHGSEWGTSERTVIRWPEYNGIDYSKFKNWSQQQGLFPLKNKNQFVGAYDHGKKQGIVRTYPSDLMPGTKLWCFSRIKPPYYNYADDMSIYYEIFGGNTETQDDYTIFKPEASLEWTEYWYPVTDTKGFIFANKFFALNIRKYKEHNLNLSLAPTTTVKGLKVMVNKNDSNIFKQTMDVEPSKSINFTVESKEVFSVKDKITVLVLTPDNVGIFKYDTLWEELKND